MEERAVRTDYTKSQLLIAFREVKFGRIGKMAFGDEHDILKYTFEVSVLQSDPVCLVSLKDKGCLCDKFSILPVLTELM